MQLWYWIFEARVPFNGLSTQWKTCYRFHNIMTKLQGIILANSRQLRLVYTDGWAHNTLKTFNSA